MNKLTQAGLELQKALGISDMDADQLGVLGMVRLLIGRYHKADTAVKNLREKIDELQKEKITDDW